MSPDATRARTLSEEDFDRLLQWLAPNREQAAQAYERVRCKLIRLFVCRGCPDAEQLADETIDRVTRALSRPGFAFEGDCILLFYGVARNVHREYVRRQVVAARTLSDPGTPEDRETLHACLDHCLEQLTSRSRDLILQYYHDERKAKIEQRRRMAERYGLGANALRIQVHRIRTLLRECVTRCRKDHSA